MCARIRYATRATQFVFAVALASGAGASTFDGSSPLDCAVARGHDCVPAEAQCRPLKAETHIAPVFRIDFAKREVKSPYRTKSLPIAQLSTNGEALVLHGADLQFAWSALINTASGLMTVAIADRLGAYVVFGQCKASE
jgi:hypothetical protein